MRRTSGLHDCPLIVWTEGLRKSGQCSLDEPRFKGHPCGLAVRIEFLGHSQRLQGACDASGRHNYQDDAQGTTWALLFFGLFEYLKGCTRCSAVAFDRPFDELEQKGLGRRDAPFGSAFSDSYHLA